MKIPDSFLYDKRVIDRLTRSDPAHKEKIREFREKAKDSSENSETLKISEMYPGKGQKGNQ